MDRAKPVFDFIAQFTSKPPTRRQRFMSRLKKFVLPVLVLGGIGASAGIARSKMNSTPGGIQ
jgi:ABC-type antimicrobial peptide transport system permease subunit